MPDPPNELPRDGGFWDTLQEVQRQALRRAGRLTSFKPQQGPLCFEGDRSSSEIVIILSGWAKVTADTGSGYEVVLAVRGPGEIIGDMAALFGKPRTATVLPLVRVDALTVSGQRFRNFLGEHPGAWWSLAATLVARMDELGHRLLMQAEADSVRRLAYLLDHLARLSGHHQPPGPGGSIEILPPLSQSELGRWMNASRETAARGLRTLRDRGLVTTSRRKITVLDPQALRAYAEGSGAP